MLRRTMLALPLALPAIAQAQDGWPNRPLRLVLGYPPGGSVDAVARILQVPLQEALRQPVVIENRGGAAGAIGTGEVARAAPDGYTWTILFTPQAMNEAVQRGTTFNIRRDFAPTLLVGTGPLVLVAHRDSPYQDMAALLADARARPDRIPFSTGGAGTLEHISMVLLQQLGNFRMTHVPYRGGGPALQAVLSRDVPVCMSNAPIAVPHITAGTVRALGVTSREAVQNVPGAPAISSFGFPGFEALNWWIIAAPAGTPQPIIRRMHGVLDAALRTPATRNRLEMLGMDVTGLDADAAQAFLLAEADKWQRVAREAGITADG